MLSIQTVAINKPNTRTPTWTEQRQASPEPAAHSPVPGGPEAPASDALTVVDLHKSFRSGFLKRHIRGIEGVSFSVAKGTVFALIGHNGAGKTTTINCILDLVHPDRGEVRIMGQDHRHCASRTRVGYLPERPYFFEHLSGRELLAFYADLLGLPRAVRRERIDQVLARTGMTHAATRRLKKLSKGMLQRIGLAQALLGEPDLLILDEPMSGLDPMGRREVRELLLELKAQGKTIILSSHIVPDVEAIADSVGILREGRLVETRSLRDCGAGSSYQVQLGGWDTEGDGVKLPDWAEAQLEQPQGNRCCVTTDDVAQLSELLAVCHEQAIAVHAVDTQRTGLEEIFMAVHAEHRTEVVS